MELNIDRSGQWNDQHANGDAMHDQQENGHLHLFGETINCFGCTGAYGMWPLCEKTTPPISTTGAFHGNVYDPVTHMPVHSTTWNVPGADVTNGDLHYGNNDYYGNANQQVGTTPDCISSKSCAQLRNEFGGWPAMNGDAMVCGESDTIGAVESTLGGANGDTRGSCTGGMNSAANGMANGGNDGSNGQRSQGWAHADQMCKQAGARLCTVRELLLDVTSGTGCQHDGELIWTFEGCRPQGGPTSFVVSQQPNPQYHIVAQGSTARGREACPDQCGHVREGTACACTPRCASDQHIDTTNGNSFAHRCCADVSPQTQMQAINAQQGGCAAVAGYNGPLMAAPTVFGQQAACAGGANLFGETYCGGAAPAPTPPTLGPPPTPAPTCPVPSPVGQGSPWTNNGATAVMSCPPGTAVYDPASGQSVTTITLNCANGVWNPTPSPFWQCTPISTHGGR